MTSSADLSGYLGCGSTGMPRPLSVMVSEPSASRLISMRVAWPATASSIALSSTSEAMVQCAFVDAADVHAGPAANRLKALEHLDMAGVIVGRSCGRAEKVAHADSL